MKVVSQLGTLDFFSHLTSSGFFPISLYLTVGGGGVGRRGVGRRGVGAGVLGRVGREAVHRVHRVVGARGAVVGLGLGLAQGQGRGQGQEELDKRGKNRGFKGVEV